MSCLKQWTKSPQENDYATSQDFCNLFAEHMDDLYQLCFLLTGNHETAEKCFVAGLEESVQSNRVFREWARSWAKRTIVQNAIRELKPRPKRANSFSSAAVYIGNLRSSADTHFGTEALLALEPFDRFVFVMSVLEHYSEHDCTLLLRCTRREIEEARSRAIGKLVYARRTMASNETQLEELQSANR